MSMDISEFENYLNKLERVQQTYDSFLRKFLLEMGLRTLRQTKKLTPVDVGDLRRRWELSEVKRQGNDLIIEMINPMEYASFVEDGHMQRKRFLPLKYLEEGSPKSQQIANAILAKYGEESEGIMLKDKWIPGKHMARISISKMEREIPKRYERAFDEFLKGLEVN